MSFLAVLLGLGLIVIVLVDAFETIVLPRTVMRRLRLSNLFFDLSAQVYHAIGRLRAGQPRQTLLVAFAPLLLLALIVLWAVILMFAWGLIHWALSPWSLGESMYFSGVTFLTLGYGDLVGSDIPSRTAAVLEAGIGFGYLALVIGYVPVLYTSFSRRESQMLLLDSKAGSEASGMELLKRHAEAKCMHLLPPLLKEWEVFSAQSLESYLSYPLLAYYRSQHDDQSWLKSLTAIMDACTLIEAGIDGDEPWLPELRFQARATFAMARHLIVDLAYILDVPPVDGEAGRLTPFCLAHIRQELGKVGLTMTTGADADQRIFSVVEIYEPYARGLAEELVLDLPLWCEEEGLVDNWQTSAWEGAKHF